MKALDAADEVEKLEEEIDIAYAEDRGRLSTLTSSLPASVVVLLYEALNALENAADSYEDSCDIVREVGEAFIVKRGYLLLITGLLLGFALASLLARVYGLQASTSPAARPENIDLVFLYTSEKEGWITAIKPLFEKYFYEKYGIRLNLALYVTGSHESVNLILSGSIRPDVWSPASSIWIPYLESKWKSLYGTSIVGCWYPVLLSPIVIAGWSDLVEKHRIDTFRDLYMLAKLGVDFKYGHTDPMLSNSGLMALLLEFCEAVNKTPDKLTLEDIRNPAALDFVKTVEQKAVYYGKSTGFFG